MYVDDKADAGRAFSVEIKSLHVEKTLVGDLSLKRKYAVAGPPEIPILKPLCRCESKCVGQQEVLPLAVWRPTSSKPFNESNYIPSLCCNVVHCRTAATVVSVVEALLVVVYLAAECVNYSQHRRGLPLVWRGAVSGFVLIVILLLVAGVIFEKPMLLWPHMAVQVLYIAACSLATMFCVLLMAMGDDDFANHFCQLLINADEMHHVKLHLGPLWPFCLAVLFSFCAAVGMMCHRVVRGCYDYVKDKQAATETIIETHGCCELFKRHLHLLKPSFHIFILPTNVTAAERTRTPH